MTIKSEKTKEVRVRVEFMPYGHREATIRDGELTECEDLERENIEDNPKDCIAFIQAIQKAMEETN